MTLLKLKYIDRYRDRTGKARYYFRRSRGTPRIALPGAPGSAVFMEAYQQALDGDLQPAKNERGAPGTFDRLITEYFRSPAFLSLAGSSQIAYQRVIERWLKDEGIGHRLVRQMRREHVHKMLARRIDTPGAANDLLKKIRILIGFAIELGWRRDDPTLRMRKYPAGDGHHTWTEAEIAQYQEYWAPGTRERLALSLLLHTGQRRSDVAKMSWRDTAWRQSSSGISFCSSPKMLIGPVIHRAIAQSCRPSSGLTPMAWQHLQGVHEHSSLRPPGRGHRGENGRSVE